MSKVFTARNILKAIAIVLIIPGLITFIIPTMFTTLQQRDYNVRYESTQAPLFGVRNLLIQDDVLYTQTTGSDCLVAFNMNGKPLYSIYLKPSDGGGGGLAVDKNGYLVVDAKGEDGYQLYNNGKLIRVISYDDADYKYYENLMINTKDEYPKDSQGREFSVGFLRTSIICSDFENGQFVFARNPFPYYLFSFPVPGLLYILVGYVILSSINKKEKRERKDDIYLGPNGL